MSFTTTIVYKCSPNCDGDEYVSRVYKIDGQDVCIKYCQHVITELSVCSCCNIIGRLDKGGFIGRMINGSTYLSEEESEKILNRYLPILTTDFTSNIIYCNSCKVESVCDMCGKVHAFPIRISKKESVTNIAQTICQDCYAKNYETCICCGESTANVIERGLGDNKYSVPICKTCAPQIEVCSNCGGLMHIVNAIQFGEERVCRNCIHIDSTCHICGVESVQVIKNNNLNSCKDCYKEAKTLEIITGYGRTRPSKFLTVGKQTNQNLLFGVENEVSIQLTNKRHPRITLEYRKRKVATYAKKYFESCECKRDGSLYKRFKGSTVETGVEIVTQPMTWQYIQKNKHKFKEFFAIMDKEKLLDKKITCCGMHVHISRNAFTTLQFFKFVSFIYSPYNREYIVGIAGRINNRYAHLTSDGPNKLFSKGLTTKTVQRKSPNKMLPENLLKTTSVAQSPRTSAVNINPDYTFELRLFKGATSYAEYMLVLEFVYALYTFTKDVSISNNTFEDFVTYVNKMKDVPILTSFTNTYAKKGN